MTADEIAQLSPEVQRHLTDAIPGWQAMTPEAVEDRLREYKADLFRQADGLLDTINELDRSRDVDAPD